MKIPVITGIIDRRILVNFHIAPEVMSKNLPQPFRPKVINGYAIGGICLIRLKKIRPRFIPLPFGISSENAAHRIAVEWDKDGETQLGVYIPRRDTSSLLNSLAGGTIFPGEHNRATFKVKETDTHFSVHSKSRDNDMQIDVAGSITDSLPKSSVFSSVQEASTFFEQGSLGYSKTHKEGQYDGLELSCKNWTVTPLEIETVFSSYFEDESNFPKGSVAFDCALLMQNIQHEWHSREEICCPPASN